MTSDKLILVVDDEESMRHFLVKTLRREGYDVIAAHDGPAALVLAQERPPDVALLDVRMPGMDGVALMRTLRAAQPRLPVVLMTGHGSVQHALAAMKQGADDYVTKPLRVDAVKAAVAKALAGSGGGRPPTVRAVAPAGPAPASPTPVAAPVREAASGETLERGVVAWLRERAAERALPPGAPGQGLRELVHLAELTYVDELLRTTDGNISRAAELAGITRPNMHRKILDLGLDANSYRRSG